MADWTKHRVMFTFNDYHDQFMILTVTATKPKESGRAEVVDRFDALFASLHAIDANFERLILLFEYSGKYAPLAAAELAGEPVDW